MYYQSNAYLVVVSSWLVYTKPTPYYFIGVLLPDLCL